MRKILMFAAVALFAVASLFAQAVIEVAPERVVTTAPQQEPVLEVGRSVNGFVLTEVTDFDLIGAKVYQFEHQKTGAVVLYIANEDTNRVFEITFRTPTLADTGIPHVFEHSTLDGSEKYPSKTLFFNLSYQTYNTYMNASTYPFMTTYPVASLSEDQLLALADYYTDSVFNPMVLQDKSIFDEEAWRYVMDSEDADLTIAGTVYSEMLGATTRTRKASKNFQQVIYPGSWIGNDSGGNPDVIPEMTWDDLKNYHADYYVPSNSVTCIYGKLDNWADFLQLLDGYFSAYTADPVVIDDPQYKRIDGPQTAAFEFPVESGSNTEKATTIYYGFLCPDIDSETLNKIDLMTSLADYDSSVLIENLKNAIPYGSFSCSIDISGPDYAIVFVADNVNPEDAETFKKVVDESMAQIAAEGFEDEAVDSFVASYSLSMMLTSESSETGLSVIPNMMYYWAATGDLYGYLEFIDSIDFFRAWADDGSFQDVITRFVVNNDLNALVTTTAVAGLKEQKDAALAARLAEKKASMSADEIKEIVSMTNEPEEETVDPTPMIRALQVVDVQTLPEEARFYEVTETAGEDGINYYWAKADITGVGFAGMYFDMSGLSQDQIHYFKLFSSLIGELDTTEHTRTQLANLMARYLYDGTIRPAYSKDDVSKVFTPKLRVSFVALDEDVSPAMDLCRELLFDNVFDASRISDQVSNMLTSLKQSFTNSSYSVLLYRAMAADSELYAYYNYANMLDYYYFLQQTAQLLETEPETVIAGLQGIVDYINNAQAMTFVFAGNGESWENFKPLAAAFAAGLDRRPVERQTYSFDEIMPAEALIVDTSVNFNIIWVPSSDLGYEEATADLAVVSSVIEDMFLLPELRDKRGAYGAYLSFSDDGAYAFTYRDPNIAETFDVYDVMADFVDQIVLDQENLDGYILANYSSLALSSGELTGATNAVLGAVLHEDQTEVLEFMQQLKGMKAENFAADYAPLIRALVDNYSYYTSGSASAIDKVSDYFLVIHNPFGVESREDVVLSDINEESPYYDALNFVFQEGIMANVSDTEFGAELPATLGEVAQTFCLLIGYELDQAQSIGLLSQYGILPNADPATGLSLDDLNGIQNNFRGAVGLGTSSAMLQTVTGLGVDPATTATRAQLALTVMYMVYGM